MFRIRFFARASVEGDVPIGGAALQRHRLALLALLATAPGQAMSRDKLIAFLWPESDTARARHLLRAAVHVLRRELGEKAILSEGTELRLNPEVVTSDVGDFAECLTRADRSSAIEFYAGSFLDGFHLNDAPEFEHWLDGERARLERLFRAAVEELAESAVQRGDFAEAAKGWRQLWALDPFSARVTLGLMRALEATGDRAAAIQLARTHEEMLCAELGAEADPTVAAFAERLRVAPQNRLVIEAPVARAEPGSLDGERNAPRPQAGIETAPVIRSRQRPAGVVMLLSLALLVLFAYLASSRRAAETMQKGAADARTIAVLPFTNIGGDPGEEYFSDGLTEELIAALARVHDLRVAARTSVFAFKGEDRDIRQIGRALNVATILEGSVRKTGDSVRVHVQLINAENGFHTWSESYDRSTADIFELQTEVALRVAEAMTTNLTAAERQQLARTPTENLEAHSAYLKGRFYWNQRSGGGLRKAISYFEQAIAADPRYAKAYAGIASAYGPMGVHGFIAPDSARERMLKAISHALELDPDLPEARTALATYKNAYEWDFAAAEKEYLRAIALDPNESTAHTWYGFMLEYLGRLDEAVAQRRMAVDLDPVAAITTGGYGYALLLSGRPRQALTELRKAVELDSGYWQAHVSSGIAFEVMGDLPNAIAAFEKARTYAGNSPKGTAGLAGVLARSGRKREARVLLDSLRRDAQAMRAHAPVIAISLLATDGPEPALAWLEESYHERHPDLPRVLTDPRTTALHNNPRFIDLRRRVGLTK